MSDSKEAAIRVTKVSKAFRLPHEKTSSLKGVFVSMFNGKKTYERQQVLKDVSFEIKEGEFFGIVGRNGSGKSTLLKLLAGIYSPDSGNIQVNGKLTPFIELGVGFNPELTGRENVFLNGALLGFNRKEMLAMYDEIVEFAELEKFMDQKLKNYSSGMQVRLAFAIAIMVDSDILLFDEVLAVGDQSFQDKCFKHFRKLKESNKTVILVTHDMSNVEKYCDRALIIDKQLPAAEPVEVSEAVTVYNRLNYSSSTDDSIAGDRKKHRDIYLDKVEILDNKQNKTELIKHGEKLTIRLHIGKKRGLPEDTKLVLGLAIYDKDNVNIAGPNSSKHKITLKNNYIDYIIEANPFAAGRYRVAAGIFDQYVKEHFDFIDSATHFIIESEEIIYGKISLKDRWMTK